jgi:hypothetical protein
MVGQHLVLRNPLLIISIRSRSEAQQGEAGFNGPGFVICEQNETTNGSVHRKVSCQALILDSLIAGVRIPGQ